MDDYSEIFDDNWVIKPELLKEFVSEPFRVYMKDPEMMKAKYPEFYDLITEAIQ